MAGRTAGAALAVALVAAGAAAAQDTGPAEEFEGMPRIGSKSEAMQRLAAVKDHIREEGIAATAQALHSDDAPFAEPYPAVSLHRIEDGRHIIAGHTTYPQIQGMDFTERRDLAGRAFIQDFFAQVKAGGGTAPTTHAVPPEGKKHLSQCYSEWAPGHEGAYWLVTCYDHPKVVGQESGPA